MVFFGRKLRVIIFRKRLNESFGFVVRGGMVFRIEKWEVLLENDLWCN